MTLIQYYVGIEFKQVTVVPNIFMSEMRGGGHKIIMPRKSAFCNETLQILVWVLFFCSVTIWRWPIVVSSTFLEHFKLLGISRFRRHTTIAI